jgi:hypothetical protein
VRCGDRRWDRDFSVVPMLVCREEWAAFHDRHRERGSHSGSQIEVYSYSHYDEPGPGLQGFVDGNNLEERYSTSNSTARRFAYPYIHSGVQFGILWMTTCFAETLCPHLDANNIAVAGYMNCKTDWNATPPCHCDHPTHCNQENSTTLRKVWMPPGTLPFPLGCDSWRRGGSPKVPPVSPLGPSVETALREEGLWNVSRSEELHGHGRQAKHAYSS